MCHAEAVDVILIMTKTLVQTTINPEEGNRQKCTAVTFCIVKYFIECV